MVVKLYMYLTKDTTDAVLPPSDTTQLRQAQSMLANRADNYAKTQAKHVLI